MFVIPHHPNKMDVHPDSDLEDDDHLAEFFPMASRKNHPEQLMVCAQVAKLILRERWTSEVDKWLTKGTASISRCTITHTETNEVKLRDDDGNIVTERRIIAAAKAVA